MKKLFTLLFVFSLVLTAQAQNKDLKRLPSVGFQFSFIDFKTAQDLRSKSIATVVREKQWYKLNRYNPAFTLNYTQGISNQLDFMGRLTSSFLLYPVRNFPASVNAGDKFYLEADANVNLKLLTSNYWVVPYIQAGLGAATSGTKWFAYMPLGLGMEVNLWDEATIHLNSGYRVAVNPQANYSLMHSFGLVVPVKEKKAPVVIPAPVVEPPKDKDGDGVLDDNDDCPDVAGLSSLKGCPDSDKDGIADKEDKCPSEYGLAKYGGCPIPDSDKDGINDENDKCPTVAGVARYDGCPVPDSDADGINDEEDKCPAVPGVVSNAGCPEIKQEVIQKVEMAAKNIYFETGSFKLLKKSFKPLDEVVTVLNENPTVLLDVEGYTDNTGDAGKNQILSEKRAATVKEYLVSKGIDASRISSAGYGADRPVADNKTQAGRAKNRRVELKLRSY
jgi:OmpA-OmpF porin, OOP family